ATADATFIASKPLVTDPLLPQFARPGDRFAGGLLLANGASSSVAARTQADLRGAVRFAAGNGTTVQASRDAARGMNAWRFDMLADRAGTAHLTVRTELASGPADALAPRVHSPRRVARGLNRGSVSGCKTNRAAQIGLRPGSDTRARAVRQQQASGKTVAGARELRQQRIGHQRLGRDERRVGGR